MEHSPQLLPDLSLCLSRAWARNTINTCIFRGAGLVTAGDYQFGGYDEAPGRLVLFRRDLRDGSLTVAPLPTSATLADAHNGISLGCDPDGFLHLSHDHHGTALQYRRSRAPFDIEHWEAPTAMTGLQENRVTYPCFLTPRNAGQPLLFLYRHGSANEGDIALKRYDAATRCWQDLDSAVFSGAQQRPWPTGPYLNHPAIDRTGRLHLFVTWRSQSQDRRQLVNNHNIDYARSADAGQSWKASNGAGLRRPMTPGTGETALGTPPGSNLMNQAGAAVDSRGRPFLVSYMNDPRGRLQYFLLWHSKGEWHRRWLPLNRSRFNLQGAGTLASPLGRPDLVIDHEDRAWVIFRAAFIGGRMAALPMDAPEYRPDPSRLRILWDEDLLFCEPVIDRTRWERDGVLSMLLQRTDQGQNESLGEVADTPVTLAEWRLG